MCSIKTICFPNNRVIFNIFGNSIHLILIADNVVVKAGLPSEVYFLFVREFSYR